MRIINGDPKTFENKEDRLYLHWGECVMNDRVRPYRDHAPENQHMNADLGWEEHLEPVESEKGTLTVRWWIYKGRGCKESPPLVICFQEYNTTCWQRIADREGLVIVAFEYHRNQRIPKDTGHHARGFGPQDDEMATYRVVVEGVMSRFGCDRKRLYMFGLSYGDMSALRYAICYGETLAAAAFLNGPTCLSNIKDITEGYPELGALPVFQLRSEDDLTCDGFFCDEFFKGTGFSIHGKYGWMRNVRSHSSVLNRNLWLKPNGIESLVPRFSSKGERVFAVYGGKAELIYCEAASRCHIPAIDTAEVVWKYLFSRCSRGEGGELAVAPQTLPADRSFALATGCSKVYVSGEVKELAAKCVILSPAPDTPSEFLTYLKPESLYESFYAPVEILSEGFGVTGLSVEPVPQLFAWPNAAPEGLGDEDVCISFQLCGKQYQLYSNTCVAVADGETFDLHRPPMTVRGALMVPVKELAELFGLFTSEKNDAIYVTDHPMTLGFTLARLLREEILSDEIKPFVSTVECLPTEGGKAELSAESVPEGGTLTVRLLPEAGFKAGALTVYMNGLATPLTKLSDEEYDVLNVYGDLVIEAAFERI